MTVKIAVLNKITLDNFTNEIHVSKQPESVQKKGFCGNIKHFYVIFYYILLQKQIIYIYIYIKNLRVSKLTFLKGYQLLGNEITIGIDFFTVDYTRLMFTFHAHNGKTIKMLSNDGTLF